MVGTGRIAVGAKIVFPQFVEGELPDCGKLSNGMIKIVSDGGDMAQKRGVFITFEGGDGCGKSTNIELLAERLRELGLEVLKVREPGGTKISEGIREMLLSNDNAEMTPVAELFLYEAARAQIVAEVIEPALSRGAVVLCDRFFDSTTAYQAYGRGLDRDLVARANLAACQGTVPDRTVVLRLADGAAAALKRAAQTGDPDRMESAGEAFHEKVALAFVDIAAAEPERVKVVEVSTIEETAQRVWDAVADLF